ncbi:hypothetical protein [Nocardiopsis sp. LOL_012]|uniref:hypothetical protein n=1 Tax=Nocardiopsis sp. LOL_012 TaxID=3345409 RepID=UPI003A88B91E
MGWWSRVAVAVAGAMVAAGAGAPVSADGVTGAAARAGLDRSAFVSLRLSADERRPRPGEEVVFRASVANTHGASLRGAVLVQHLPEGLEVTGVGGDGEREGTVVSWGVDVPEGGESVFTLRTRVPEGARDGERLETTACLRYGRGAEPVVCAGDAVTVAESAVLSRVRAFVAQSETLQAAAVALTLVLALLLWRRFSPNQG